MLKGLISLIVVLAITFALGLGTMHLYTPEERQYDPKCLEKLRNAAK